MSQFSSKIGSHVVALVVGFIAALLLFPGTEKVITAPCTGVQVIRDTVYVPRTETVTIEKEVPRPYKVVEVVYKERPVYIPWEGENVAGEKRSYRDTLLAAPGLYLAYDADVIGSLERIALSYKDTRPQKVFVQETVVEKKLPTRGLYIGIGASSRLDPSGGFIYQHEGNLFGAHYSLSKEVKLSYHRRLF